MRYGPGAKAYGFSSDPQSRLLLRALGFPQWRIAYPQLFCQVCSIGPVVRDHARVGGPICPSRQGYNLIHTLTLVGAHLGWPGAGSCGTHPFERAAARAFMFEGGTFAELPRAGRWRGAAVRFYVPLKRRTRRGRVPAVRCPTHSDGFPLKRLGRRASPKLGLPIAPSSGLPEWHSAPGARSKRVFVEFQRPRNRSTSQDQSTFRIKIP